MHTNHAIGTRQRKHRLMSALVTTLATIISLTLVGCTPGDNMRNKQPIIAEASLPPEILQQGVLKWVNKGGQILMGDVSIGFPGVQQDNGEPTATFGIGTSKDHALGGIVDLHLGESITYAGIGTFTLVSFSAMYETVQTVTLLIDLEPQPTPTPTASPS